MTVREPARPSPLDLAACGAATAFYVAYALWRGQDANWDLQNYHDYAAYALLHWRFGVDVAPGDFQGYLNALPYVAPYLLRRHLSPMVAAAALAALQSTVLWVAWRLTGTLIGPGRHRAALRLLALTLAATGALPLSEVGTSFCDLLLAGLTLASLDALLRADTPRAGVLCGFLGGAAAGLKLTSGVFAPALILATMLRPRRDIGPALLWLAVGGIAGFSVTAGWWGLYLWHQFANPVFPLLNTEFRSPDAVASPFSDRRWIPDTLWQALGIPFAWASGRDPSPGAEIAFRDPRFAVVLLSACILGAVAALRPAMWAQPAMGRIGRALAFLIASFALWTAVFAIARYILPLDMLAGILVVALAALIPTPPLRLAVAAALSVAVIVATQPNDLWHRPWAAAYRGPDVPAALAQPAAYLLADSTLGYLASRLPPASRFYRLEPALLPPGGQLRARLMAGLLHPPAGGAWLLAHDMPAASDTRAEFAALGFAVQADCHRMRSLWWVDAIACRLAAADAVAEGAADLAVDRNVAFTPDGSGWAVQLGGWGPAEGSGSWAVGARATLLFRISGTGSAPLALHLDMHGVDSAIRAGQEIGVAVDGIAARPLELRGGQGWTDAVVCLGPRNIAREAPVTVTLTAADLRTPRELGVSPDDRPLIFTLRSLRLAAASPDECPASRPEESNP